MKQLQFENFPSTVFTIDPCNKFKTIDPHTLLDAGGYIPIWILEREEGQSIKQTLIDRYPFYMGETEGATVDCQGVYTYPDDPPLYPLFSVETNTEKFYMYQYGMVAVLTDTETWVTRMD